MKLILDDTDELILSDGDPLILSAGAAEFTAGVLSESSHTHNSATLTWTAATDGEGTVDEQLEIDDGGGFDPVGGQTSSPGTASGLSPSTAYDFRVSYTDDNETIYSNVVEVTTNAAGTFKNLLTLGVG